MSETQFNLAAYMSDGIREFMATAYRNVLSNPREARFVHRMRRVVEQSAKRRREVLEKGRHTNLSTIGFAIGFVLMMAMDVLLG